MKYQPLLILLLFMSSPCLSAGSEDLANKVKQLEKELKTVRALNENLTNQLDKKDKENNNKRNHNFVQVYRDQLLQLRKLTHKNKTALSVLLLLVEKMNKQNSLIISQNTMIKILGKSRQTISKSINILKNEKFIDIVKVGSANAYIINANVFWQHSQIMKDKTAIFTATVFAVGEEQEEKYFENWEGVKLKSLPVLDL